MKGIDIEFSHGRFLNISIDVMSLASLVSRDHMNPRRLVFVYGTLMSECPNNGMMSTGCFITRAIVERVEMYLGPGYPYASCTECPSDIIYGEVWAVDQLGLLRLDALEGVSVNHYKRVDVIALCEDTALACIMYCVANPDRIRYAKRIESGDWKKYIKEQEESRHARKKNCKIDNKQDLRIHTINRNERGGDGEVPVSSREKIEEEVKEDSRGDRHEGTIEAREVEVRFSVEDIDGNSK